MDNEIKKLEQMKKDAEQVLADINIKLREAKQSKWAERLEAAFQVLDEFYDEFNPESLETECEECNAYTYICFDDAIDKMRWICEKEIKGRR
jgi:hypothetical protein